MASEVTLKTEAPPRDELKRVRMSYEQYLEWADEDVHAEWVDGEVIIQMPPRNFHQVLIGFLHELLDLFVRLSNLGIVQIAPFEMRLSDGNAWEPDILVLLRENLPRLSEERLEGPADLVIEIVSRSSVAHDRDRKFRAYEAGGVRECWLIDSRPNRQRADFYRLDEQGNFRLFGTEDDERINSVVLPGFWFKPAWLWAAETPEPLTAFFEMAGISSDMAAEVRSALQKGLRPPEV